MNINSTEIKSSSDLFAYLKSKRITFKLIQRRKIFTNTVKILRILKKEPDKFNNIPCLFAFQLKTDIENIENQLQSESN